MNGVSGWHLYIVRCRDNSLYTGITMDVGRRFAEHCSGRGRCARCLRGKGPLTLVFFKKVGDRSRALKLEYRVKRLPKISKERIIEERRLPYLPPTVKRRKGARGRAPRTGTGPHS